MEALPIEIITYVMRLLPLQDLYSCSLVCKKWYSALLDPSISSRLVCRLDLQDGAEKGIEVASCARSRLISHLTVYDNCTCSQSGEGTMFWMNKDNKFEMITTLLLGELVDQERAKFLLSITTIFTNVKVVEMYSSILFEALDDIANGEKVLSELRKIPKLHLVAQDDNYYDLPRLLNTKLNVCLLLMKYVVILKHSQNDIVIAFKSCRDTHPKQFFALHGLIAFSSQKECALHFEFLDFSISEFKLSEVVAVLNGFPKLSIDSLRIEQKPLSILREESSCLNQILKFGLNHFVLRSGGNIDDWFSNHFSSSAIFKFESFKRIECHGNFNDNTLEKIFMRCPFTVSLGVHYREPHCGLATLSSRCCHIKITYRTVLNGHLNELSLSTGCLTFKDLLSVVPLHLQEFSLTLVCELHDQNFFMKLNNRCPNIRKLTITFQKKITDHHFLGEMGKLEELSLIYCSQNVMENMSFPCLKKLTLWFHPYGIRNKTILEIASAFGGIKSFILHYWVLGVPTHGLKKALPVLARLEEFKIHFIGEVSGAMFDELPTYTPFVTSLTLFKCSSYANVYANRVREFQNMYPDVKVTFLKGSVWERFTQLQ